MARPIKITEEFKRKIVEDVKRQLENPVMRRFSYEKTVEYEEERTASLVYSPVAWFKTRLLVDIQPKEVGWHGICRRDETYPTTFYIEDIVAYPQRVTGASINPDAAEYTEWMNGLDDYTFNHLRFHGHSHVNMAVYSSSIDDKFRKDRLSQLSENDFYVFQVFNKRGEIHSEIYDYRENIFYEDKDIDTLVECDSFDQWDSYVAVGKLLRDIGTDLLGEICNLYTEGNVGEFLANVDANVKEDRPKYGSIKTAPGFGTYIYTPNDGDDVNGVTLNEPEEPEDVDEYRPDRPDTGYDPSWYWDGSYCT